MIVVFCNTSHFKFYVASSILVAPWRQLPGMHTPVEYALHSYFIPSDVAMSAHGTSQTAVGGAGRVNVAACFMVLGQDGKPWTMRMERERRYGNVYRERTFSYRPSFPKIMV